jgi:hypothetical protein
MLPRNGSRNGSPGPFGTAEAFLRLAKPAFIAVLLTTSLSAQSAALQKAVLVPEAVACDCRLELTQVTTLTDPDGRAGLSAPLVMERTSDGRYLVVPTRQQGTVLLFDASGRYEKTIGRVGQGPHEFRAIIAIRGGLADSTVLMDAGNSRLAVLDPALAPTRTVRVPVRSAWFGILADGRVVILAAIPPAGSRQDRVHVFSAALEPIRSFMRSPETPPGGVVNALRRRMSVSADGTVAVAHNDKYVLELWTAAGLHLATLSRDPDWFRLDSTLRPKEGPSPRFETPRVAPDGMIWTVSHVPDANWRNALGTVHDLYGRSVQGVPEGAQSRYWDSVIELIDPKLGVLLGSVRLDAHVGLISDDGFAAGYREDELGNPSIDVWRIALVTNSTRR